MVPGDQIDCKQAEDDRVKSDDELGRERVNAGGVPARTSRAVTRAATRQHQRCHARRHAPAPAPPDGALAAKNCVGGRHRPGSGACCARQGFSSGLDRV